MHPDWLSVREQLLFSTPLSQLAHVCGEARNDLGRARARASLAARSELAATAAEIVLDLRSVLPIWRLANEGLADSATGWSRYTHEADAFDALLAEWGEDAQRERVKAETASMASSNLLRLTQRTMGGDLKTWWGHDYASGVERAMRRGAMLVTTNPPLVNLARKEQPAHWEPVRESLRRSLPHATGPDLAARFTAEVVLDNCRRLRPLYSLSGNRLGLVNLQVNPWLSDDAPGMARQIVELHDLLRKRLGGEPNVVFKIPGTRAGLDTASDVTGRGIGVTVTLGFAVDQHLAFAEAIRDGCAPISFLVMMNGRLDDPIRDELQAAGVSDADTASRWASTAVVRRSYGLLTPELTGGRSNLLIASLRGPWNLDAAVTDDGAETFVTAFPDKAEEYDAERRPAVCHMGEPVPAACLDSLRRSSIFRGAWELGALGGPHGFAGFHPVAVTLNAFRDAWDDLCHWLTS